MKTVEHDKIVAEHLRRNAYLYVRQSTFYQVINNTESARQQYDLRRRAVALGWPEEQIVVIDEDQGCSGASAIGRNGFQHLVAEVGMGKAGIVMGLEVSRLARNNSDWHRLLEICALSNTLILDQDGVYDPAHFNDRLLLGLKGTMSEAELHVLRARLQGGYLTKARRGELRLRLPVGFVYDAAGQVQLDPDRQVGDAIGHLFATFRRQGSAAATVKAFYKEGLRFPCRPPQGPHMGQLLWQDLTYSRVLDILHNPRYSGAYVLGQTRQRKRANGHRITVKQSQEHWQVLLRDAHAGYISWQEYEENLRRLRDNRTRIDGEQGSTPPREGAALLQGIVVCGVCGKRMSVRYHQRNGRRYPWYFCKGRLPWQTPNCQDIPGAVIDEAIGEVIVEAMTPMALEVALSVQQELISRAEEADRLRREQVERARYAAEAARRRYMRVDPDNRMVADSLEADWNEKLRALATAQQEYERQSSIADAPMDCAQRDRIATLATDFPAVWRCSSTSARDRKRMLRLLIEDVTLIKAERTLGVHVRFCGGGTRSISLPRPVPSWKTWLTPSETVAQIDLLLEDNTYDDTAETLNASRYKSGKGCRFHAKLVRKIQRKYGLKSRYERLRERGLMTDDELAKRVGVTRKTVLRWRLEGCLVAYEYNERGQCLYDATAGVPEKGQRPRPVRDGSGAHGTDRTKEVQYET
jgi:DNA invertase Pin-like site-specific DNA recombinase